MASRAAVLVGLIEDCRFKRWQQERAGHRFGPFYLLIGFLHYRFARIVHIIRTRSFKFSRLAVLRQRGEFAPSVDVTSLKAAFQRAIANQPLNAGHHKLQKTAWKELAGSTAAILREVAPHIESIYGCPFEIYMASAHRNSPSDQEPNGAFWWHYDDVTTYSLKVFIYLNRQVESNGAFRLFDEATTHKLMSDGFDSSSPERREASQRLVTPDLANRMTVMEGDEGSVFVWHNRLIHKATLPRTTERDLVQLEIRPTVWRTDFEKTLQNVREKHSPRELLWRLL
jgi:hypothetical protein